MAFAGTASNLNGKPQVGRPGATLRGSRHIAAPRDLVWSALNDVDILRHCIPGCEHLERRSATEFRLCVMVRLGPVKAAFHGGIFVVESDGCGTYTMVGRGDGGLAGLAQGTASIRLTETRDGCRLAYTVDSEQTGSLAYLGMPFIAGLAKALTDRFTTRLATLVMVPASGSKRSAATTEA